MDKLDFLDGADAPQAATPVIEPEAPATPSDGPSRDAQGRFVGKEAEPAATPETTVEAPQPAPVPPPAPEPQHVPLSAHLDEREKRQAAERRAQEYEDRIRRLEAQSQQPPPAMPDPYEDPEGFAAHQQRQMDARFYEANRNWSRRIAEIQHGAEKVAEAHEWGLKRCGEDPFFNQKVLASQDPYGVVMAEFQREALSAVDPSEFQQYLAWKASQGQAPPNPAPPAPSPTPPPRSLASTPSAGTSKPGEQPVGGGVAFGSIFER